MPPQPLQSLGPGAAGEQIIGPQRHGGVAGRQRLAGQSVVQQQPGQRLMGLGNGPVQPRSPRAAPPSPRPGDTVGPASCPVQPRLRPIPGSVAPRPDRPPVPLPAGPRRAGCQPSANWFQAKHRRPPGPGGAMRPPVGSARFAGRAAPAAAGLRYCAAMVQDFAVDSFGLIELARLMASWRFAQRVGNGAIGKLLGVDMPLQQTSRRPPRPDAWAAQCSSDCRAAVVALAGSNPRWRSRASKSSRSCSKTSLQPLAALLAAEPDARVPGAGRPGDLPAPTGHRRQHGPGGHAQRASHVNRGVADRNHQIQSRRFGGEFVQLDQRVAFGEVVNRDAQVALGGGQIFAHVAVLQVNPVDRRKGQQRQPLVEARGPFARSLGRPPARHEMPTLSPGPSAASRWRQCSTRAGSASK